MKKAISIIGCLGIPARYGGFETLAENISVRLSKQFEIQVFCSKNAYPKRDSNTLWNNITRRFLGFPANGFLSIFYDLVSMIYAVKSSDILLVLGGSSGIFFGLFRVLYRKKKIIFHPDGMEWKRSKWSLLTKIYLKISIKAACKFSHHIIIDNESLIKEYYKYRNKLTIISYGGDHYNFIEGRNETDSVCSTIARAEPENNLQIVADCFKNLTKEKWILVSNYKDTRYGKHLNNLYKNTANIIFVDKEYDPKAISNLFSRVKGYIHPHSMGGTNPSLVAAMWSKKQLLCHDNPFNRSTTKNYAHFFSDSNELLSLIKDNNLLYNPSLFDIAQNDYNWGKISSQYANLFENSLIQILP